MKSRSQQLLDRSISAMLAGIEIYNKPLFPYRIESFTMLAIIIRNLALSGISDAA